MAMNKTASTQPTAIRHNIWTFALLICLSGLLSICGLAQPRAQSDRVQQPNQVVTPAPSDRTPPNVLVAPDADYRLSPGDTIDIAIEDAPELSQSHIITAGGDIEMPFLGRVVARGKTANELAKIIATALRQQDYLKQPQVRVTIKQYNSQTYFIQGSVRQPGVYQLAGRPSLVKLISLAGGLSDNHGPTAMILRPIKAKEGVGERGIGGAGERGSGGAGERGSGGAGEGESNPQSAIRNPQSADPQSADPQSADPQFEASDQYDLIKVNLAAIYQSGRFENNFRIEPGDIVNVPPANVFFVAGEVHAPGSFQLKEGTTLRQAIALAQGTNFKAKLDRTVIFRDNPETGRRQEIQVHIGEVMSGKREDIPIYPNDVIIVPNSRMKSISSALLMALGANSARLPVRY
jgi:polysaccharide export outer membrane protein